MKQIRMLLAIISTLSAPLCAFDCWSDGCSRLYLGPQVYHAKLNIDNTDANIGSVIGLQDYDTHLDGTLWGVNGGYRYKNPWGLYANVDLDYGQGKLKGNTTYNRYIHEFDVDGVLGYYFGGGCQEPWSLALYAGLGYLLQNHSLSDIDVKYRYHIYHVPVGVKFDYAFCLCSSTWTVGLDLTVLPQIDSTVSINQLHGARWKLSKRTDWRVALPIKWCSDCYPFSVRVDLFWNRLNIGSSKAVTRSGTALGLPSSQWNAYGASLDFIWGF